MNISAQIANLLVYRSACFAHQRKQKSGFTLIEMLLAVSIIFLMSGLILGPFSQFRTQKTLDATVEEVFAAFSRAHIDTISSLQDSQYGVHLDADKVVYFVGTTYVPGAVTNSEYELSSVIEIGSITLVGGVSDVIFQRLSGATNQSGTFEIRAKSDTTRKVVVTVNGTGAISL